MKLQVSILFILLSVGVTLAQDQTKLEIVNVSPYARIEAAPLSIDSVNRKFSFALVVENTSAKNIRTIFLEYKFEGEIRRYDVNINVHDAGTEIHLPPNEKRPISLAENAALPAALNNMSSGTVSITRIEFEDGTVWERPKENKDDSKVTVQPNNSSNLTPG